MAVDILNLSDEEILKLDPSTLVDSTKETEGNTSVEGDSEEEGTSSEDSGAVSGESEEDSGEGQGDAEVAGDEGAEATDAEAEGQATEQTDTKQATEQPGTKAKAEPSKGADSNADSTIKSQEATEAVDYKAAYEKLTAPFTANGREMSVKSVDDAIALMQMGANYNKKMAALKPNLKLMKMLETNGLMSEEKINFLIDLEKKNPDAINKLIKDSGLDPLELDTEKADGYKPTQRTVTDSELELDSVLDEIQNTPSYKRTIEVVANEWDAKSKQIVGANPQLLKVINSHVQSGIYDLITAEVESERVFGRLSGLSDIEAYRQVGDAIQARGGFDHLSAQGQQTKPAAPAVLKPAPKKVDEQKLNEKRRAASAAKPAAAPAAPAKDFNPLALSDDEFSKLGNPKFM